MSDHTFYNSRMEMVTHGVYFQRQSDSKISTLIKACRSLGELIVGVAKNFCSLLDASTTT